ncbi:hypothetical protein SNEBB_001271 [Seison nebaliae]|nr:hypothetical protein SNEBB_001271 [Seison nebaliae]
MSHNMMDFSKVNDEAQIDVIMYVTSFKGIDFREIVRPFLDHLSQNKYHVAKTDVRIVSIVKRYLDLSTGAKGLYNFVTNNNIGTNYYELHASFFQRFIKTKDFQKMGDTFYYLIKKHPEWRAKFLNDFPVINNHLGRQGKKIDVVPNVSDERLENIKSQLLEKIQVTIKSEMKKLAYNINTETVTALNTLINQEKPKISSKFKLGYGDRHLDMDFLTSDEMS